MVETLGDEDIERQIEARNSARRSGDFPAADRIRQELDQNGVILEDTKGTGKADKAKRHLPPERVYPVGGELARRLLIERGR